MKFHPFPVLALLGGLGPLHAASISLASTMDGNGYMAESQVTGGFSRINLGDGKTGTAGYISSTINPNYANSGDRDGHYLWNATDNPATIANPSATGTGWDLFPRETNFQIGSITFDESLVSTTGTSIVPITTIDLSAFWTADPGRTNGTPGHLPSVISDISDDAIGLWLFGGAGGISFGALDAEDTLTFTNGQLTSINLELATAFAASAFGIDLVWDGTFSIEGNEIAYQIDDTKTTFVGDSRFVADLRGTVNSVIPEPSAALLGSLGALALLRRRRA